jgi:hypothetical protein
MSIARTQPHVLVKGLADLGPEGGPARPAPLAHHIDTSSSKSTSSALSPRVLAEAAAALDEGGPHGQVASSSDVAPLQVFSSFLRSSSETTVRGPRGLRVASFRAIGSEGTSPFSLSHLNRGWRRLCLTGHAVCSQLQCLGRTSRCGQR